MWDLDALLGQPPYRKGNGQFAKGAKPFNKGKSWDEWLSPEMQAKIRQTIPHKGRKDFGGENKKSVLAIKQDIELWFESAAEAARQLNLNRRNVQHVVDGQRPTCGGWRFKRSNVEQFGMKKNAKNDKKLK